MYKECTKNLKKGTSILSSSTPTSQGKVANQPGSQGFLNHTYPELSVARATLVYIRKEFKRKKGLNPHSYKKDACTHINQSTFVLYVLLLSVYFQIFQGYYLYVRWFEIISLV